jgi:transcriptional regulator with XRE-family HTH domain
MGVHVGRHPSRRHVSPEDAPIGPRIRQRRRDLELTQADLAAPDYTKSFISQLEGGFADPSLDTLRFLSRRLRMSLSTVAGDRDDQRLAGVEGLLRWARDAAGRGDEAVARRVLGVASEMASAAAWDEHRAEATLLMAEIEIRSGALDRAALLIEDVGVLAATVGQRMRIRKELAAGLLLLHRGDTREAAAGFQRALGFSRRSSRHPDLTVRALFGLAAAATQAGDFRHARRRLQTAATLSERQQLDTLQAEARFKLGTVLSRGGANSDAAAEAVTHLEASARLFAQQGKPQRRLEALLALAAASLIAGNPTFAVRAVDEAAAMADATATGSARIAALRGRALLAQDRPAEAAPILADAVAQLAGANAPHDLPEAALALANYHQTRGEHEAAARYRAMADAARAATLNHRRFEDRGVGDLDG